MPLRLDQLVGDAGWQLSAGERARVFAARAVLSRSPIVILDGLLDSLDPEACRLLIDVARSRGGGLLLTAAGRGPSSS